MSPAPHREEQGSPWGYIGQPMPVPTGAGFHGYGFGFTTGAGVAQVPMGCLFSRQVLFTEKKLYFYVLNMATRQTTMYYDSMNCEN
jgi:hypothetical protein